MRNKFILVTFFLLLITSGCQKKLNCKGSIVDSACNDQPPATNFETLITCGAYFERWFYNASTNECEKIVYNGYSGIGFETQLECETCLCHE